MVTVVKESARICGSLYLVAMFVTILSKIRLLTGRFVHNLLEPGVIQNGAQIRLIKVPKNNNTRISGVL